MIKKVLLAVVALALFLPYGSFNQEKNNFFETKEATRFLRQQDNYIEEDETILNLEQGVEEYKIQRDNTNDENQKEKYNNLIQTAQDLIDSYRTNKNINVCATNAPTAADMAIIVSGLMTIGYDLGAEFLLYSLSDKAGTEIYKPIYGGRIYSSPLIHEIIESNKTSGSGIFDQNRTTVEEDLHYSIQRFSYTRSGNIFTLNDRYDYKEEDKNNPDPIKKEVITKIFDAEKAGVITYFDFKIELNITKFLYPKVISHNNGKWVIELENKTNELRQIIYNSKLCNKADARNWTNLTDIEVGYINPNSKERFEIAENGNADHIAISYTSSYERYSTLCSELKLQSEGLIGSEYLEDLRPMINGFQNIGKNGSKWIIKVFNNSNQPFILQYNSKMCFDDDARNWTGLKDVKETMVYSNSSTIIVVSENYTATSIALRLIYNKTEKRVRLFELEVNTNMNYEVNTFTSYRYLKPSISGKKDNAWKIFVKNTSSNKVEVEYNEKMCFDDDAKNWNKLNDIKKITLNSLEEKTITIYENWWATTIALSYKLEGKRIITYANNLNTNGSLSISYNVI